jgi:hypothetical protein
MAAANLPEALDSVLGGLAVALLIVFLGALRATLRRKEGEAGAWSATAVIGGSVLGAGALVAVATDDAHLASMLAFPAATVLVAGSVGILSTHALPPMVGYAGLVGAGLQLFVAASLEEVAIGAFVAWAGLTSLAMLRQRGG